MFCNFSKFLALCRKIFFNWSCHKFSGFCGRGIEGTKHCATLCKGHKYGLRMRFRFLHFLCRGQPCKWINQKSTLPCTQCKCLLANHLREQNSSKTRNFEGITWPAVRSGCGSRLGRERRFVKELIMLMPLFNKALESKRFTIPQSCGIWVHFAISQK